MAKMDKSKSAWCKVIKKSGCGYAAGYFTVFFVCFWTPWKVFMKEITKLNLKLPLHNANFKKKHFCQFTVVNRLTWGGCVDWVIWTDTVSNHKLTTTPFLVTSVSYIFCLLHNFRNFGGSVRLFKKVMSRSPLVIQPEVRKTQLEKLEI